LRRNNFGGIIKSPLNIGTILRLDSRWRKAVRLNDLDGIVYIHGERLDDAGWVANRWSEMLPITLEAKQALLELTDSDARLQQVERYLKENGVI
jgi:hypothetical protein